MEAFEQGGEYQWSITSMNTDGEEICESVVLAFTKPLLPANAPQSEGQPPEEPPPGGVD